MSQRLIKIVLPQDYGKEALELLGEQGPLGFWQEESADGSSVISALTVPGDSERIMDLMENRYSAVEGFKLLLIRVEASLPRPAEEETAEEAQAEQQEEKARITSLRISREELHSNISESSKFSAVYVWLTILSTIVAAIGLLNDNIAVIIGAMVIAPFLGPNVALALSTNLADRDLGLGALKTTSAAVVIVIVLSAVMGFVFDADPSIPEIAARTNAGLSDIILALAAGCAAVLAFTTGASATVIGVMVAVALLPPLTVAGLMLGSGDLSKAAAAFLLFMTNTICINLAGVTTFFLQGVSPRNWWEADKARKSTRIAFALWTLILAALAVFIYLWQANWAWKMP